MASYCMWSWAHRREMEAYIYKPMMEVSWKERLINAWTESLFPEYNRALHECEHEVKLAEIKYLYISPGLKAYYKPADQNRAVKGIPYAYRPSVIQHSGNGVQYRTKASTETRSLIMRIPYNGYHCKGSSWSGSMEALVLYWTPLPLCCLTEGLSIWYSFGGSMPMWVDASVQKYIS